MIPKNWHNRVVLILKRLIAQANKNEALRIFEILLYHVESKNHEVAIKLGRQLFYCIAKHVEIQKGFTSDSVYGSSAFLDLKLHFKVGIKSHFKYYRQRVEEELEAGWGASVWYFEMDADHNAIRQIIQFEHRPKQRYSLAYLEDEHGGLATTKIEDEYLKDLVQITEPDFNQFWLSN